MKRTFHFVLEHGLKGHHHLFADELLRRGLFRMAEDDVDPITASQVAAMTDFLEDEEDFDRQRDVIASAPEEAQAVFVRFYFEHLFRVLQERRPSIH